MDGGELSARSWRTERERTAMDVACRALDLVATVVLLVLLAPLLLLIALIIKLDSPGPVLFRQQRVGRDPQNVPGREVPHDAARRRPRRASRLHARADRVGHAGAEARGRRARDALRRRSCAARASTSCRSCGTCCAARCRSSARARRSPTRSTHYPPHWFERFAVKPGVTGLWQVSGRSEVSLEEMIELDVEYVRRRSVLLERLDPAANRSRRASHDEEPDDRSPRSCPLAAALLTALGVVVPAGASASAHRAIRARRP